MYIMYMYHIQVYTLPACFMIFSAPETIGQIIKLLLTRCTDSKFCKDFCWSHIQNNTVHRTITNTQLFTTGKLTVHATIQKINYHRGGGLTQFWMSEINKEGDPVDMTVYINTIFSW